MHKTEEFNTYIKGLLNTANILEATSSSFVVVNRNLDVIFSNTDLQEQSLDNATTRYLRPGDLF
ncbi:MAG: hypothetical protein RR432_07110, partial [Alistipes sp.]